jgi:hypothetical protein
MEEYHYMLCSRSNIDDSDIRNDIFKVKGKKYNSLYYINHSFVYIQHSGRIISSFLSSYSHFLYKAVIVPVFLDVDPMNPVRWFQELP